MPHYRLYFMNNSSGHIDRAQNIKADDDVQAVEAVRTLAGNQPLELWQDTRKVHRFESSPASLRATCAARAPQAAQASLSNTSAIGA